MCLQGRNHGRTEAPGNASSAPTRQTEGAGRSPGSTELPDSAVMGPGRSQPARTASGRPSSDVRRAAAVFRHRHGGTPSRLSRGTVTRRRAPLRLRGEPGCAGANLTGPTWGGAGVLRDARICRAAVRGSAVPHRLLRADTVRDLELWPVPQAGMIDVLTMHRQYSAQKKFPFLARNFPDPGEPDREPRRRSRQSRRAEAGTSARTPLSRRLSSARTPWTGEPYRVQLCFRSARQLVEPEGEALFVDRSATGLDQSAPHS